MNARHALIKAALLSIAASSPGCGSETKFPCRDSRPVQVGGRSTGIEQCASGALRRHEAAQCPSLLPRATTCEPTTADAACSKDADCTARPHGRCDRPTSYPAGAQACGCTYGCVTDAECGDGMVCLCGDPVGRCVRATCTSDAECNGSCLSQTDGCGDTSFACQTPADQCATDSDCPPDAKHCVGQDGTRACTPGDCAVGRPLVVSERVLTAQLSGRSDWA